MRIFDPLKPAGAEARRYANSGGRFMNLPGGFLRAEAATDRTLDLYFSTPAAGGEDGDATASASLAAA